MQEQITHVRCPACRSTVKAFDTHCWVCGTALADAAPRDTVVIDAATQDIAPAAEHGFDGIARRIAHLAPPGASNGSQALIPVGPLRTVNERTYFRRPPGTPRRQPAGPFLLPAPAARSAHLAPPPANARRNSAAQPLMAVAAMVFMAVAALTFAGRYLPDTAAAESASAVTRMPATAAQPTGTGVSSLVAIDLEPAHTATQPAMTPTPRATRAPTSSPTAAPTALPTATATVQATTTPAPQPSPTNASSNAGATAYLVKNGDSCSEIARAYNISLASLIEANKLDARCRLLAGQTLTIPAANR